MHARTQRTHALVLARPALRHLPPRPALRATVAQGLCRPAARQEQHGGPPRHLCARGARGRAALHGRLHRGPIRRLVLRPRAAGRLAVGNWTVGGWRLAFGAWQSTPWVGWGRAGLAGRRDGWCGVFAVVVVGWACTCSVCLWERRPVSETFHLFLLLWIQQIGVHSSRHRCACSMSRPPWLDVVNQLQEALRRYVASGRGLIMVRVRVCACARAGVPVQARLAACMRACRPALAVRGGVAHTLACLLEPRPAITCKWPQPLAQASLCRRDVPPSLPTYGRACRAPLHTPATSTHNPPPSLDATPTLQSMPKPSFGPPLLAFLGERGR